MTDAAWQQGLNLPLLEAIADWLSEAAAEHRDEDVSATYLLSAPEQAT